MSFERCSIFREFNIYAEIQNFRVSNLEKNNDSRNFISDKMVLGFLGRVTNEKGIFEFIDLAKQTPNYEFIISGPFNSKSEKIILNKVNELKNLNYIGVLDYNKINLFFDQINLFFTLIILVKVSQGLLLNHC